MERVHLAFVQEELPGNRPHERVGAEFLNKFKPSADSCRICALGRLLDTIRDRLFTLIAELADRIEQRDRCHWCRGCHMRRNQ